MLKICNYRAFLLSRSPRMAAFRTESQHPTGHPVTVTVARTRVKKRTEESHTAVTFWRENQKDWSDLSLHRNRTSLFCKDQTRLAAVRPRLHWYSKWVSYLYHSLARQLLIQCKPNGKVRVQVLVQVARTGK